MLELKHITYEVETDGVKKRILNDVNLTLKDHTFTVITGPNGGGKSTLAKVIAGIITPTSGEIWYDGQNITDLGITERANLGISFAFQQPVRFKGIKVKDLLELAVKNNPNNKDKDQKANIAGACDYLGEVGLCARDYINREINASLSGGELKRIEIATIIARATKLSLFDEPEAGIDLWSFKNLIKVFEKMHDSLQGEIIVISHQERILNVADEIVVIADGSIVEQGDRESILPKIYGEQAIRPKSGCKYMVEEA